MPTAGEYRVVEAVVQSCRLPVELRMCGMGPRRAAAICAEFERDARPRGLALLGWAGGLRDHLAVGDIVIADRALSAGRSAVNCLAPALPGLARVHRGPVLTAGHVIAAPVAKRSAATCGALAVEMEAYPLAAWAAQHETLFVHGRVILDTVDDALPELGGVLDGYGHLQIRPLLGALARRPALLGEFTRMVLRLRGVNRRLAELAEAVAVALLRL
jgi:nucleoside phosphorylase